MHSSQWVWTRDIWPLIFNPWNLLGSQQNSLQFVKLAGGSYWQLCWKLRSIIHLFWIIVKTACLGASRRSCYWLPGSQPGVSSFSGSYLWLWNKGSYRFAKYQGDSVQKHTLSTDQRELLSGVMAGSLSEGRGHSRIPGYCLRLLWIG